MWKCVNQIIIEMAEMIMGRTPVLLLTKGSIVEGGTFGIITTVELKENEIPGDFTIKQNFANPFNPRTTIEFILQVETEISMSIYDILGRQVSIIYEGIKVAGIHRYQWNATGLSSGIYFCRLNTYARLKLSKWF